MFEVGSPYTLPTLPTGFTPVLPDGVHGIARRASRFLFVSGGLLAALGVLRTLAVIVTPAEQLLAQQQMFSPANAMQVPADTYKIIATVASGVLTLVGAGLASTGLGVRRGSRAATWVALVVTVIMAGFMGLGTLLVLALSGGSAAMLASAIVPAGFVALLGGQAWSLVRAVRSGGRVASAQHALMQQFWQQQQMVTPASGGYGYATQPGIPDDAARSSTASLAIQNAASSPQSTRIA